LYVLDKGSYCFTHVCFTIFFPLMPIAINAIS